MTTDAIWSAFSGRLRGFIAKRVREADVDDVLQDVFAKIHAGLGGVRDDEKLEAWLFQVARRAVVDHHRVRRPGALPDDVPEKSEAEDLDAVVASWLAPMMSSLPEEDREALRLRPQELAATRGLSPSGAKSRVQRARLRLKEELLDCCHIEMDRRGHAIDVAPKRPCDCYPRAPER